MKYDRFGINSKQIKFIQHLKSLEFNGCFLLTNKLLCVSRQIYGLWTQCFWHLAFDKFKNNEKEQKFKLSILVIKFIWARKFLFKYIDLRILITSNAFFKIANVANKLQAYFKIRKYPGLFEYKNQININNSMIRNTSGDHIYDLISFFVYV